MALGAGAISFALTSILALVEPIANVFSLVALDIGTYALAIVIAFCVIPIVEIVKLVIRKIEKSKAK